MLDKAAERKFDTLVKHDLEAYPYPTTLKPATFDAVVCVGVMDFIRDPRAFMVHARSFMKPARTAVVGAVNGKNAGAGASATTAAATSAASFDMSLPASVLGITIPERHPHSDLSSFSRAEMETLFRETGFLVERHERFMGYFDSNSGLVQYYHGWLCTMDEGEK